MNKGKEQVELDQDFPLFLPEETRVTVRQFKSGVDPELESMPAELRRIIVLGMVGSAISIHIIAAPKRATKLEAVTPFSPKIGYQIDGSDYNSLTRLRKHLQYRGQDIPFLQAPLRLVISSEANVSKLRFTAVFPSMTYESRPVEKALEKPAMLIFECFYPATQGGLSIPLHLPGFIKDCLAIQLPWDPNKSAEQNLHILQLVRGRFYLDSGIPWSIRRAFGQGGLCGL